MLGDSANASLGLGVGLGVACGLPCPASQDTDRDKDRDVMAVPEFHLLNCVLLHTLSDLQLLQTMYTLGTTGQVYSWEVPDQLSLGMVADRFLQIAMHVRKASAAIY